MNRTWWKEGVVYQIYPKSFADSNSDGIGDLRGIASRLDYLQDLGITTIWLNPVYASPNVDQGYDISDYYSIMTELGTFEDWKDLLDAIHARGLKLIMDLVVNHTSDHHAWFIESRGSKDNKYRDFYVWRQGKDGREPNNWSSFFSESAWELDPRTGEYYLHLFSRSQPDLNWENADVREEIYTMMTWWLQKGIDGFRMDVINVLSKTPGLPDVMPHSPGEYVWAGTHFVNGPRIHDFLKEMREKVLSHFDIMTVGECVEITTADARRFTNEKMAS